MMKYYYTIILLFLFVGCYAQLTIDSLALTEVNIINEKEINTEHLEFSPVFYHDYIMIVKSDTKGDKDENIDDYFLNLSYVAKNSKGELSKQAFFDETVNSSMHEGPAWYNRVNGRLYFTRAFYDVEKNKKRDTIVRKIYEAREDNNFKNPIPLSFCSEKYSVFHPTLDNKGTMMIFASDMPGSKKSDLYYSVKTDKWSEPKTLSENINSEAHELFPYLYRDSILFFCSNRETGIGGLDIYYSLRKDSTWTLPKLLPYPINSSFDDIGFLIEKNETSGYFSSNRPGGEGKDDIYRFETLFPIIKKETTEQNIELTFNLFEKLTFESILSAEMTLGEFDFSNSLSNDANNLKVVKQDGTKEIVVRMDANMKNASTQTTEKGALTFSLKPNTNYLITVKAKGFEEETIIVKTENKNYELSIFMNPISEEKVSDNKDREEESEESVMTIPTEVGSIIVFNNLYYNYNSTEILESASEELNLLYESMKSNPTMRIQLSSHTDSRGNFLYNKELSIRRANSAKNFLIKKGIDESRIKTIGFGESRIRNHCTDGVECNEEEHAYNRRTEVLVIE